VITPSERGGNSPFWTAEQERKKKKIIIIINVMKIADDFVSFLTWTNDNDKIRLTVPAAPQVHNIPYQ
jgi:hypothetical protein